MKEDEKNRGLISPWAIGIICMIAVVLTANITMIVIARMTSPGLVVEDYYEKGKNYHKSVEKIRAQRDLAWQTVLLMPEKMPANGLSLIKVSVKDSFERPVTGGRVELRAFRPSDASRDFYVEMKPESEGTYAGMVTFPLPGYWDVVVTVVRGGDEFEIVERIFVDKLVAA